MTCMLFMPRPCQPAPLIGVVAALLLAASPAWCAVAPEMAGNCPSGSIILGAAANPDCCGAASHRALLLVAGQQLHCNRHAEVQGTHAARQSDRQRLLCTAAGRQFQLWPGEGAPASLRRQGVIGFGSHRRPLGDFAASPVERRVENRNQFIAGAGIGFSF